VRNALERSNSVSFIVKTRGFIAAGYVDPDKLLFARDRVLEVREALPRALEDIESPMIGVRACFGATDSTKHRISFPCCGASRQPRVQRRCGEH
jgi:hypothetical protein